jgi:hypothetical protein
VLIPDRLLVVGCAFGPELDASAVCDAIARGVEAAGRPRPDVCPIFPSSEASDAPEPDEIGKPGEAGKPGRDPRALLDELGFDARMHPARAVVIVWDELHEGALAGTIVFEVATRARQGGVPCYAIARRNLLDRFDTRILDLQAVIEAGDTDALAHAGQQVAALAWQHRQPSTA